MYAAVVISLLAIAASNATVIVVGYRRKRIREMQLERQFCQHARHDGPEGFGFSQGVHSLHNGGNAA